MALNWFLIQQGLSQWIQENSCVRTMVWGDQNVPRPLLPFVYMKIENVIPIGNDFESMPESDGHRILYGTREFSLNLRYFGSWNSVFELEGIVTSLSKRDVRAKLLEKEIIVLDTGEIQDTSFLEEPVFRSRADVDIRCRTSINIPYGGSNSETSIIEKVNISGVVKPAEKVLNITVPN